jgi:hypothetical protein
VRRDRRHHRPEDQHDQARDGQQHEPDADPAAGEDGDGISARRTGDTLLTSSPIVLSRRSCTSRTSGTTMPSQRTLPWWRPVTKHRQPSYRAGPAAGVVRQPPSQAASAGCRPPPSRCWLRRSPEGRVAGDSFLEGVSLTAVATDSEGASVRGTSAVRVAALWPLLAGLAERGISCRLMRGSVQGP